MKSHAKKKCDLTAKIFSQQTVFLPKRRLSYRCYSWVWGHQCVQTLACVNAATLTGEQLWDNRTLLACFHCLLPNTSTPAQFRCQSLNLISYFYLIAAPEAAVHQHIYLWYFKYMLLQHLLQKHFECSCNIILFVVCLFHCCVNVRW